jgi:type II restriction/modification system DNA methylase subunit YeeA
MQAVTNLTRALKLPENQDAAFMGDTKGGGFDIPGELAREWLLLPVNPNGRPNSDVLRPWRNGMDMTRRARDMWIIDFGWKMSESEASLFEAPFQYVKEHVFPERAKNRRDAYRLRWWRHVESRPGLWRALEGKDRVIVTPEVSRHRVFSWLSTQVVPDHKLQVIAKDDYTTFGILLSKWHHAWSLGVGSWHGVGNDPRYTISSSFETFPFPRGLTPNIPSKHYVADPRAIAISKAAKRLDDLRNAWLNPPDLVHIEAEVVPGYPNRILPKDIVAAVTLRERTLTNLYNQHPQWLVDAHRDLDTAVAAAYGWAADISEEDALARLLELNLSRASETGVRARAKRKPKPITPEEARKQPQFKLPITGGKQGQKYLASMESPFIEPQKAPKRRWVRKRKSA